jgi:hypothetical protein
MTATIKNNAAATVISNARAALKLGVAEGNARQAVALGLFTVAFPDRANLLGDLEEHSKEYGKGERDAITTLAGENAELLKKAKDIFKARLADANVIILGFMNAVPECLAFFTFDAKGKHTPKATATEAWNAAKKAAKGEGEKGEGEEKGEEVAVKEAMGIEGFRAGLAGLLARAKAEGILPDCIGVMIEAGQSAAVEA